MARLADALENDAELVDDERVGWCRKEIARVTEDADPRAYWRQATWRRITAIVAGPAANVIAAFVILTTFYGLGVPKYVPTTSVNQVQIGSPAQHMGLEPGDVVIGAQGKPVKGTVALRHDHRDLAERDAARPPRRARAHARPREAPQGRRPEAARIRLRRASHRHAPLRPLHSVQLAGEEVWLVTKGTGAALKNLVSSGDRSNVQGVVGIVRQQSTAVGQGVYLEQLAWLSLSLALFNLLPFLPLDGGHVLFALIERLRRKPLAREIYERVSLGGIAVFLVLFLLVLQ